MLLVSNVIRIIHCGIKLQIITLGSCRFFAHENVLLDFFFFFLINAQLLPFIIDHFYYNVMSFHNDIVIKSNLQLQMSNMLYHKPFYHILYHLFYNFDNLLYYLYFLYLLYVLYYGIYFTFMSKTFCYIILQCTLKVFRIFPD